MKKRLTVLAGAGALALLLAVAGAAWAAEVPCEPGNSQAAPCLGTTQPDTVTGTAEGDFIRSLANPDTVKADGGPDTVQGGKGKDLVRGAGGNDGLVYGGEAGPEVSGPFTDASDDVVRGGAGNDIVVGGYGQGGVDEVFGGDGDDFFFAGQRGSLGVAVTEEVIDCGPGEDTVIFDLGLDRIVDRGACERLISIPPSGPTPAIAEEIAREMPELPFE